jgi:CheY-like chemotaxis protein
MSDQALILIVDDGEVDVVLMRKAFQQAQLPNPVQVVRDGEEAVAYLGGQGKFSNRVEYPLPHLVLLDLNMPRMSGFEVLTWIRKQPGLRGMVVIVLTSSSEIRDVNRAYQMGANSFFVKDLDFQNFIDLCKLIQSYWLRIARLPESTRSGGKPNYLLSPWGG